MSGEIIQGNSGEVHGLDANGWAKFYGFEAIKDYPYNPKEQIHLVGKDGDGANITVGSQELLETYLQSSIVKDGGEAFVAEVAQKGTALIQSWFVETEPGKYTFSMKSGTQ